MSKSKRQFVDESNLKHAYRELKGENNKLKKEVSRLRKQLKKYIELEYNDLLDDAEPPKPKTKKEEIKCKDCSSTEIKVIDLGIYTLNLCLECGNKDLNKGK